MPMTIVFYETAIRTLTSPAPPLPPLRDIIRTIRFSKEINALAIMGRDILRSCMIARCYNPKAPISEGFMECIDNKIGDHELSVVVERCGLLERLKLDEVAIDTGDRAQILLAYLGAAFMASFKEHGTNSVHDSINDICSMVLEEEDPSADENNSHEKMTKIPGVIRMTTPGSTRTLTPVKHEPPSTAPSSTRPPSTASRLFDEVMSTESVSSGRSPPPLPFGAHYQQSYQPYYPPNPSNPSMYPPHMQPMHNQSVPPRFPSYTPGPVHTASPTAFAQPQPQYQQTPPPSLLPQSHMQPPMQPPMQPSMQSQSQPQTAFTQPLHSAMPSGGYPGMGMPPNPSGFAAGPPPVGASIVPQQTQGFISLINELAMKHRKAITWQQQKIGQQHMPEWTLWLYIDGQLRGQGTATTKQAAKEIASKVALVNMGWVHG